MAALTQYVQVLSKPEETFTTRNRILCPDCAKLLPGLSKMGRVHGAGECELCLEPINPVCKACLTDDFGPSVMQPAFCYACVQAMLRGRVNRFDTEA